MKLFVKKENTVLVPFYNSDKEEIIKISPNEVYEVSIKKSRNYQFHKKFFALVKVGHENTTLKMPFDAYRKYVIMKAGFFNTYKTHKGTMIEAKSISFDKMNEDEFNELYSRVLDVIIEDIQADEILINQQLINFM